MRYLVIALFFVFACTSPNSFKLKESQPKAPSGEQSKSTIAEIKQTRYTLAQVENKSLEELRLMRNEVFARHGYIFQSPELSDHFSQTDWYEPRYTDVTNRLTYIDSANIELVLKYEAKIKDRLNRSTLTIHDSLYTIYDSLQYEGEQYYRRFATNLIGIIDKFRDRPADTTVLTIGNIDGKEPIDTIRTRVYVRDTTVFINSTWIRNGYEVWSNTYHDPYLWVGEHEVLQFDTRSTWVTFAIGVLSGAPDLSELHDNFPLSRLDEKFRNYVKNFKGQVFSFGEPELRHSAYVWHEPSNSFVEFYSP